MEGPAEERWEDRLSGIVERKDNEKEQERSLGLQEVDEVGNREPKWDYWERSRWSLWSGSFS